MTPSEAVARERAAALRMAETFGRDALACVAQARVARTDEFAEAIAEEAKVFARWAWRAACDADPRAVAGRLGVN